MRNILFIDDEFELWEPLIKKGLNCHNYEVICIDFPKKTIEILTLIKNFKPDVILLDIEGETGEDMATPILAIIHEDNPFLPVVLFTSTLLGERRIEPKDYPMANYIFPKEDINSREGAPYAELAKVLNDVIDESNKHLKKNLPFVIGNTLVMRAIADDILKVAPVDTTVLITGESGTGKELVADALHFHGRGREIKKPLVKVNCAALSDELLLSELFGHVEGAFTGAKKYRKGRFEMADGGSIFLDEIGDTSLKIQISLLRVLQQKTFERVGDSTSIPVDTRVIVATNQDLIEKVRLGVFREDLYYRLKIIEIKLPPLRERRQDISLLSNCFLDKFNKKFNKRPACKLRNDTLENFEWYKWPGNIRELENSIEQSILKANSHVLTPDLFPALSNVVNKFKAGINNTDVTNTELHNDPNSVTDNYSASIINKNENASNERSDKNVFKKDFLEKIWDKKILLTDLVKSGDHKQRTFKPIMQYLVDKWISKTGKTPTLKQLANEFLDSNYSVMRSIFNTKCGLSIKKDWPKEKMH